ncbi:MAG TPA: PQQ-binding-like beta-propeller repeat protein [Acidimicrobiales bacterium]|jgi:polyvinyl alcohol dehydrogenase (cytochrome)|nr:PQQ-binding-like beta-propeller repeat protein [Acidimicrobiales bacterium]
MTRRRNALLLGAVVLAAVAPAIAVQPVQAAASCAAPLHPGGDWPAFGPDPANSRAQSQETTIGPSQARSLAPAWSFAVASNGGKGGVTGTPVVADGCTFVGTDGGHLYALNADTGDVVWHTVTPSGGGVNGTLAVTGGRVFAFASRGGAPYAIALSEADGSLLWSTPLDSQPGSDVYGSPVVYNGVVFAGVSGGGAELASSEAERYAFQGAFLLLDEADGHVVKKTWTIHEPAADGGVGDGFAGATIWSTPAVDADTGFAYVGTGNPFQPQKEHAHANSVIKVDLRRGSATFGEIVGNYKGNVDEFVQEMGTLPCQDINGNPPPWYPQGAGACGDIDLDFGAAPNIFKDASGRKLVGDGQKSGVYHAFDPDTLAGAWKAQVGPPGAVGGIVGTASVTGAGIAGPITPAGYLWSVDKNAGMPQWAAPVADGAHWGHQTSSANGVVYTMDVKGFLDAYDAATGVPLLHRPVGSDSDQVKAGAGGLGGGVSIARNTVYAPANGIVAAFRPGPLSAGGVTAPEAPKAPGGVGPVIASGPGAFSAGYTTRAMVVQRGGSLTYANADIAQHDVVSREYGPATQAWCPRFPAGKCPLIWSDLISVGTTTPVLGLENVKPGVQYNFYCTLHPNMQGTIVVAPE